ncbi:MAG: N-acetylmuramoyl-L-alanine amidase [Planctomycetota bacterium]
MAGPVRARTNRRHHGSPTVAPAWSVLVWVALAASCAAPRELLESLPAERRGDEIVACGRMFHTGTRVVLWSDPGGYDAYQETTFFPDELRGKDPQVGPRFGQRRGLAGGRLEDLRRQVDQFVLHYDVCGTSRQCFKILHDHRKLSVHFLLDVDGTVYQTLDLRERAWHATKANDRAVGVEIAHIGAYPRREHRTLVEWYGHDAAGPFVRFPAWMKQTGVAAGFVGRPARPEIVRGTIQGQDLWQYDFTVEQYEALARLTATLATVIPAIRLDAPCDVEGAVRTDALDEAAFAAFHGVLGHYHVQTNKTDPGPAMDWQRLLGEARAQQASALAAAPRP